MNKGSNWAKYCKISPNPQTLISTSNRHRKPAKNQLASGEQLCRQQPRMACSIRNRLADLHGTPSNRSPCFIYRRQLVVSHPIRNQSNGNASTPGLNTCRNSLHFQRISYTWHSCTNMSIQCSRSSFTDRSAQPAYTELKARSLQKRELNCKTV